MNGCEPDLEDELYIVNWFELTCCTSGCFRQYTIDLLYRVLDRSVHCRAIQSTTRLRFDRRYLHWAGCRGCARSPSPLPLTERGGREGERTLLELRKFLSVSWCLGVIPVCPKPSTDARFRHLYLTRSWICCLMVSIIIIIDIIHLYLQSWHNATVYIRMKGEF